MTEPLNSWEVSYVINLKMSGIGTGISLAKLRQVLDHKRRGELQTWAETHFTPQWLYEHTQ